MLVSWKTFRIFAKKNIDIMANEIDTAPALSYEVFDRQLQHFQNMLEMMVDGWEDYNSQEMTCDILSLCTKASRLCYMADQDLALQHTDVTQQRKEQNEHWRHQMEALVREKFSYFVLHVADGLKDGKMLEGHESPMFSAKLGIIFPRLHDLLMMEGMEKQQFQELQALFQTIESMVGSEAPLLLAQLSNIPGVSLAQETQEASPSADTLSDDSQTVDSQYADPLSIEMLLRFWNFFRLYAMASYLLLHFRRVCHVTSRPLDAEATIRLTESKVQRYMNDEEGKRSLYLYQARLRYENDGKPLDVSQWLKARRELKAQVPPKFELAFLYYADDTNKAGEELAKLTFSEEEFACLVDVLAKYQLIPRRIFEIDHPEEQSQTLPNEAFNIVVKGRSVDLLEVKKTIAKMVPLVEKKNQWFCVWSVLRHLNLIREGATFATFAHQMMSTEWFGKTEGIVRFTADNLSDYSHYFNEYDFTDWDEELFLEKKELYGMTKWSPKLCQNFSSLCERMMKAIWGYRFLG